MSNPYQATATVHTPLRESGISTFLIGARNGFLWSLLVAVPAAVTIYDHNIMSSSNSFDPDTFAPKRIPLTNSHRVSASIRAGTTVLFYVILPWTVCAGMSHLTHWSQSRRNRAE
ncbi:hypothetical protein VN12_26925 [Pirellula sp. SH-Sr6A]|nr:hypothetical protein VN12_26925 [Pirellula sp. SH-Sr6A]